MAALEILALDETTPQIRAPASGDAYKANRKLTIAPEANGNALAVTGFSLTGANAQSLLDLAGTWNTTGTPTAIKANVADTASNAASLLLDLQVSGASKFSVGKAGQVDLNAVCEILPDTNGVVRIGRPGVGRARIGENGLTVLATGAIGFSSAATIVQQAPDVYLSRDGANTLALRNGVNAQAFNLYNTYTDGSNHERGFARFNASVFEIGTAAAGTGTVRDLALVPGSGGYVRMGTHSAIAGETVTGYITIKDAGGTNRKLAVVS